MPADRRAVGHFKMDHAAMRVVVLMGGPSSEHAVSLKSGQGVVGALTRRRWAVEPMVIPQTASLAEASDITKHSLQRLAPEIVFIALHGTFGEDGTVQALCEELQLPYTGSSAEVSRLGMDKVASRKRFEAAGLTVPRWWTADPADERVLRRPFPSPLVVKPTGQGSSVGVSIVRRPEELPAALQAAGQYGSPVLIEEFIEGREVTVGVVGEETLPVIEIRPRQPFFDYTAKYTAGLTDYLVPAPLAPDVAKTIQEAALRAHRALGCRHLSRSDFILAHDRVPVLLEINTIPGFTPTSLVPKAAACIGVSYDELCEQLTLMATHGTPHAVGR
jgi:D-alanine-D-alanine ligase